ncbi:hypothetical protein [Nocardia goodfellowii]|uniref:Integral membrane protein n=1 Tax=Nocardia goodfellowii TaxID=882446 RepID=A0ABS4QGY4_9NOCA|nr:hypothetical protein [Nocardia goodfellowii]MBP2190952.1 hypothetical protein [Nocardia goodfellowii]
MNYPQPEPYPGAEPYPGGSYEPYGPGGGKPPVPSTVQYAFYLMLAGAAVTVLSTLLIFTQLDVVREEVQKQDVDAVFTESQLDSLVIFSVAIGVATNLVSAGLWIWMAFANRAGKNWARITASVLFGLSTVFTILSLVGSGVFGAGSGGAGIIAGVLTWLIGVAAIVLLWHKRSAAYFKPAPPPGYAPPPGFAPPPPGS